jgi:ABC-type sugar transport system permease subunit
MKTRAVKDVIDGYLFCLPALLIFIVFMIYPIISGFYYSLNQWNGIGKKIFTGFENYKLLMRDPYFWGGFSHNVVYAIGTVTAKIVIGMLFALMLAGKFRGVTVYRAFYFLPMMMSYVAVGLLWAFIMYHTNFGIINNTLMILGIPQTKLPLWLGDKSTALLSIMIVDVWRWVGYHIVLYIAAIQGIPEELYEAALVDGANLVQKHWFVTIPQLRNATILNIALCFIGAFSLFDLVYVMTQGGPNRATETILTYMYNQAFTADRFGYASAICYLLFVFIIIFSTIQTNIMNKGD